MSRRIYTFNARKISLNSSVLSLPFEISLTAIHYPQHCLLSPCPYSNNKDFFWNPYLAAPNFPSPPPLVKPLLSWSTSIKPSIRYLEHMYPNHRKCLLKGPSWVAFYDAQYRQHSIGASFPLNSKYPRGRKTSPNIDSIISKAPEWERNKASLKFSNILTIHFETFSDLPKSCKTVQSSIYPSSVIPKNHSIIIETRENNLEKMSHVQSLLNLCQLSHSLAPESDQAPTTCLVSVSSEQEQFFSLSFSFKTLMLLKSTGWSCCQMSFDSGLPDVSWCDSPR